MIRSISWRVLCASSGFLSRLRGFPPVCRLDSGDLGCDLIRFLVSQVEKEPPSDVTSGIRACCLTWFFLISCEGKERSLSDFWVLTETLSRV